MSRPTTCLLYTAWNRGQLLARSLRRLSELTLPDEIVVVDDGSTDDTATVCQTAAQELDLPIKYVYTHQPFLAMCAHARNVGIKATDAEYLITSEPEMWFETDVIAQMLERLPGHPREIINVGRVLHEQRPGQQVCHCGCGQAKHETVNWSATWVCLYRREWLVSIGGWDEGFPDPWGWDDVDLSSRLRISGLGQLNDLDMVATHMWHPPRQVRQDRNEAYFKAKGFHGDERSDHPHLVTNRDRDWGVPVPRP